MGLILLDSTVIVGMLDADDALHDVSAARVRELLRSDQLAASVISYAEVMTSRVARARQLSNVHSARRGAARRCSMLTA